MPDGIDLGWDYNPGAAHVKRAQRGLIAKLASRHLEIGQAVVRHNLRTFQFLARVARERQLAH